LVDVVNIKLSKMGVLAALEVISHRSIHWARPCKLEMVYLLILLLWQVWLIHCLLECYGWEVSTFLSLCTIVGYRLWLWWSRQAFSSW
jgi:hypothetical protein